MRFSTKFKASSHCLPSPDGRFVASLLPSGVHVYPIDGLNCAAHIVTLPSDLIAGTIISFQWAPSSRRLLVATPDQILVASALPSSQDEDEDSDASSLGHPRQTTPAFRVTIRNPMSPVVGKPAFVGFGPTEDCVSLCSAFGIKFAVFDLRTGKTVEISNPKLYSPASACARGFSIRPGSHHLALLTRTGGKDWVSVHHPVSVASVSSWAPDTVDAQGLTWSPDGRWLVVWESPAHGHKIMFYTPDGHLLKTWTGSSATHGRISHSNGEADDDTSSSSIPDDVLGPGVKLARFSPDARLLAVGDASRCIRLIDMASIVQVKKLVHPTTLHPQAHPSLKVWQEQIIPGGGVTSAAYAGHAFIEAVQSVLPPARASPISADVAALASGTSLLAFDSSSALLAARLDDAPTTVWLWSVAEAELRAVLMFHANVSAVVWHPAASQTLLITCDSDQYHGLAFVWDTCFGPPQVVDFAQHFPAQSTDGNLPAQHSARPHRPSWLNLENQPPTLFYSDGKEFSLATLDHDDDTDDENKQPLPWPEAPAASSLIGGGRWDGAEQRREESPLELVPAEIDVEDDSELEDTFLYKRED